jgi:hypothetical protein
MLDSHKCFITLLAGEPGVSSEPKCQVVTGNGTVTCPGNKCAFGCVATCGCLDSTDVHTCISECENDNVKALCC